MWAPLALMLALVLPVAAQGADRLTLMLDWLPNPDEAPVFVARHEGFFARHGLDVDIVAPSDATTPPMMAATGHVDVAISYQPQLYLLAAKGVPLMRFATLVDTPLDSILVPSPGPIRSLADLKGRTLGYAVAGVEEALAHAMLADAGLRDGDTRLVNVNFQIVTALLSHRVDATISAYRNKEILELRAHGADGIAFYPEEHGVPAYDELIYVTARDAVRDPRLPRFVAALHESVAWLLDHPEQGWTDFIADYPAQNSEVVRKEWFASLCRFAKSPGLLDRTRYMRFASFMKQQGLISTVPAVDAIAVQTDDAQ
nr:ABC transporter substrate-binding protein [uncultured Lichenicoccus sp.]